jgi:hypothetical protein
MLVADRGGPTMLARIGVMRALNRHVERVFDPSRKEKHWAAANSRAIDEAGSRRGRSMSRWRYRSNWLASRSLGCAPCLSPARPTCPPIFVDATESN